MFWYIMTFFLVLLIVVLVWYSYRATKQLLDVSDSLEWITDILEELKTHLEVVHNMETFYGEPTIQNLLRHISCVVKKLEDFQKIYSVGSSQEEEEAGETIDEQNKEE